MTSLNDTQWLIFLWKIPVVVLHTSVLGNTCGKMASNQITASLIPQYHFLMIVTLSCKLCSVNTLLAWTVCVDLMGLVFKCLSYKPHVHLWAKRLGSYDYCDITYTPWRVKSPRVQLFVRQFFRESNKENTKKPALLAIWEGKPPVTCGFPSQRAGNSESVPIMSSL